MIRLLLLLPLLLFAHRWEGIRGPIDPFISGDTFRAHCDFVYDELDRSLNPTSVFAKSTIFTNGNFIDEFFEKIHPHIKHPYILVVHNSDYSIPGKQRVHLDDPMLIALFTQNLDDTVHPKLHPLPIGLENRQWNQFNWKILKETKEKTLGKVHLLYCNFAKTTYPLERDVVVDSCCNKPYAYAARRKPYRPFVEDLAASKFVLSPRGNGLDTHRLWESLYVRSYPIVKSSPIDSLYEGLPVIVVKEWSEVTEPFLEQKYQEFSQKTDYQWERLTIDFYLKQIEACK